MAAALLDMLWSVAAYERLVAVWGLDTAEATQAVTGLIGLLVDAIRDGRRPWLTGMNDRQRLPAANRRGRRQLGVVAVDVPLREPLQDLVERDAPLAGGPARRRGRSGCRSRT